MANNYSLRCRDWEIEVTSRLLIGRSVTCALSLVDDMKLSREHAAVSPSGTGLKIEDLNSSNGVFVNDERVVGSAMLHGGETVRLGNQEFQVTRRTASARIRRPRPTMRELRTDPFPEQVAELAEPEMVTQRTDIFLMIGGVIDKALQLGNVDEARRVLGTAMTTLELDVQRRACLIPSVQQQVCRYAIDVARATRDGSWINRLVQIHIHARKAMPAKAIDELYEVLRQVRGVEHSVLAAYRELLSDTYRMSSAERLLVGRVRGLEEMARRSAG